jgi:hypothetical protein
MFDLVDYYVTNLKGRLRLETEALFPSGENPARLEVCREQWTGKINGFDISRQARLSRSAPSRPKRDL